MLNHAVVILSLLNALRIQDVQNQFDQESQEDGISLLLLTCKAVARTIIITRMYLQRIELPLLLLRCWRVIANAARLRTN